MERVSVKNDGQQMEGMIFTPEGSGSFPAVLFFHGLTSRENRYYEIAEMLHSRGIAAMTVNLRGHGGSDGDIEELTVMASVSDGLAAYDFLASQHGIDTSQIGICGSSYGCTVASLVAAERRVKSLILRAPATYTKKMMRTPFKEIMAEEKTKFFDLTESEVAASPAVAAMENFTGILLVIASEKDDVIPLNIPRAFYDHALKAARREIEVMAGAPHSLTPVPALKEQFNMRTLRWFSETLFTS